MQGYISLATGSSFYLELAVNLALSIKHNDPHRPFALVAGHDMEIPAEYEKVIDEVVRLPSLEGFHGCLNKLRIFSFSPYDETMFVDSDCLLVKADMNRHWTRFEAPGFSAAGDAVVSGKWYGFDIQNVLRVLGIPFMVKLNSGVFYFRRGDATNNFFDVALTLVEERSSVLGSFHRNKLQLADEPFIGATMGMLGLKPLHYAPEEGSIMITTVNATRARFDVLAKTSQIVKHENFLIRDRFFSLTHVAHSPSLAHFVQLKPKRTYLRAVNDLRRHYGFRLFNI